MNKKYYLAVVIFIVASKLSMAQCVASFTISNGAKDTTIFNSTSTGTNLLYNWNFGDHNSSDTLISLKKPKHYFSVKCKKYNVCLTITDPVNSCINTYCDSVYISTPSLSANFSYVINGRNVIATNASGGSFSKSYWNWGDGHIDSVINASHLYSSTYAKDSLTLAVKNIYGCVSSTKKYFYTGCKDSFAYVMTNNSTIDSFTFTPWSNQTISHFTWTINGGSILTNSNQNPLVVALTAAVTYNVCLKTTDNHNCITTWCKTIDLSTGISNIDFVDNFNVFPNPTGDKININFNLNKSDKIDFTIYDVTGKKLFNTSRAYNNDGLKEEIIDLSKYNSGLYLLEMKNQTKSIIFKKIVVSKN